MIYSYIQFNYVSVASAASPNSTSTTGSALEAWEAELRDDLGQLTYVYEPLEACELRDFGKVKTAKGNGNCCAESIIKGLRCSFSHQLQYDSNLQEELGDTFRGHNYFRFQLRQYIEHNYIEFLTSLDPIFIDKYGQPDGVIKIRLDSKGNVSKTFVDVNGKTCSNIDLIMDHIHQRYVITLSISLLHSFCTHFTLFPSLSVKTATTLIR